MKIIINCDEKFESTALEKVKAVINEGLISKGRYGDQYCFATAFHDDAMVYADKTKNGTHVFTIF